LSYFQQRIGGRLGARQSPSKHGTARPLSAALQNPTTYTLWGFFRKMSQYVLNSLTKSIKAGAPLWLDREIGDEVERGFRPGPTAAEKIFRQQEHALDGRPFFNRGRFVNSQKACHCRGHGSFRGHLSWMWNGAARWGSEAWRLNANNAVFDSRRDELRDRLAIVPAGTSLIGAQ
jgi:hypothetical protein